MLRALLSLLVLMVLASPGRAQVDTPRTEVMLDHDWRSTFDPLDQTKHDGFVAADYDDSTWTRVDVPHNWDTYYGTRLVKNGNLHGFAWYRRTFTLPAGSERRRIFLFFEGVGSYATVWVNGKKVGQHAGGLTTFTLDITDAVHRDAANVLAVRADHPNGIRDLPWVDGGSERAYGFSEGSQPFGIFRPVRVVLTDPLRIEPFGVHAWSDRTISKTRAVAQVKTEIKNYGSRARTFTLRQRLLDSGSHVLAESASMHQVAAASSISCASEPLVLTPARLWSLEDPYLYTISTELVDDGGTVVDRVETPYGFRVIDWPRGTDVERGTFLINDEPVFLNGTCEYPHLLGGSHAFSAAQIRSRVKQIESAGFNAFRDAHHPHDLRYQDHWDRDGVALWTQFSAHIWFDNDAFRANFKTLLREWVRERRNSPSLVLWGLQNESELPADFARECAEIIRELDPTCGEQRLVTTCNGGDGTDWDVPQNWSGTYGGDPTNYGEELKKQILVGEYGAWRSLGLHTEANAKPPEGDSEEAMTALLETKIRLAETVRHQAAGHFQWLFSTHDNPGRNFGARGEQFADGWFDLDHVGPANNKGLFTLWGEPLDVYYMYRANYAPVATQPMVVIAGSTWPDRWAKPGKVSGIIAYSNCDEVELFNGQRSLGVKKRGARGTHFQWDEVEIDTNELHAVARHAGRVVATDSFRIHHLAEPIYPTAASADAVIDSTAPAGGHHYLYRVNCGGADYIDSHGNTWAADRAFTAGDSWGSISWSESYPHLNPMLGSARQITVPIKRTRDESLYQTFRYGREKLRYRFAVPDGHYAVELHFAEPWYGRGGGVDASGWRLFEVAINGVTARRDVDLWREAGFATALKKTIEAEVRGGWLEISFPRVASYQAVVSAIAISSSKKVLIDTKVHEVVSLEPNAPAQLAHWLNTGDRVSADSTCTLVSMPEHLRSAAWIRRDAKSEPFSFTVNQESDVYLAISRASAIPENWEATSDSIQTVEGSEISSLPLIRRHLAAGAAVTDEGADGKITMVVPTLPLPPAQVIRELRVNGVSPSVGWRSLGHLRRNDRLYQADGPPITKLPADLTDCDWLRTPGTTFDNNLSVTFATTDHVEVYVALDERIPTPPAWLHDWVANSGELTAGHFNFKLFRQRFAQGENVALGTNGSLLNDEPAAMYGVFIRPVRPANRYEAPPHDNRVLNPGKSWTWKIEVGVGSRYGFVIQHEALTGSAPTRVRYEFLDRDGAVLCAEERTIRDVGPLRFRTCESFNAGTYHVRITLLEGSPLKLGTLTVE